MEFLQKIVENVGFGKKDEKIDENDQNLIYFLFAIQ